jgi:hypothetical protein
MPELSTILVFSLAAVALIAVPGPNLINRDRRRGRAPRVGGRRLPQTSGR